MLPNLYRYNYLLIIVAVLIGIQSPVIAQKRKKLENERSSLIEKIVYTSKLIKENKIKKASTISDLNTIEQQIKQRTQLISVIDKKNNSLNQQSRLIVDSIDRLEIELDSTKKRYFSLLRKSYIHQRTTHPYQFFLSSQSIYEGFKNMIYMRQLDNFIQIKYKNLTKIRFELAHQKESLQTAKDELTHSLEEHHDQKSQMNTDLRSKASILSKLKNNESKLKSKLTKQKRDRERLNTEIENIILKELSASNKTTSSLPSSPESKLLSSNFAKNKGRLPWPTLKGIIVSSYGKHRHKTLNQVTINNNGIDIQTQSGGKVMAIFDGEVVGIANIPGFDKMVVLKHGTYYTVYSKLINVNVKKDQKIKTGDTLGSVNKKGDNKGIVHLEVWNNKTKLNPGKWILKR